MYAIRSYYGAPEFGAQNGKAGMVERLHWLHKQLESGKYPSHSQLAEEFRNNVV